MVRKGYKQCDINKAENLRGIMIREAGLLSVVRPGAFQKYRQAGNAKNR